MDSLLDKAKELQQQGARLKAEYRREKMMHIPVSTLEPILRAFVEMADALDDTTNALNTAMSELAKGVSYPYGEQRRDKNQALLSRIKGESMASPKWQRARFVYLDDRPDLVGKTVWALCDSVGTYRVNKWEKGRIVCSKVSRVIEINVINPGDGQRLAPDLAGLVLLPEFADDVADLPFNVGVAGAEEDRG